MLLHGEDLVEIRARLEGVQCKSEKPAPDLFARAENVIDDFKRDQKVLFSALLSTRHKKRQPRGVGRPILEDAP